MEAMERKNIIFDTDLGADCDDVMALDLLLSCDRAGECRLLGVTYAWNVRTAVGCIYAILKQHGYEKLPLGRANVPDGVPGENDVYATRVCEAFRESDTPTYETCEDAVKLLRRLLAENEDVTVIVTGNLTNIAALLASPPDEVSPLGGKALVKERVREFAVMAGNFSHQTGFMPLPHNVNPDGSIRPVAEYNIVIDIPAAKTVFEESPVPVAALPWEAAANMISGQPMCAFGAGKTPDSLSYLVHGSKDGRSSWDPATALYGVFGAQPWFYKTAPGTITIDDAGVSCFRTCENGLHSVILCAKPQAETAAQLDRLAMRLFG